MHSVKFTPKEQFIVASVRMITDERAKKLPRDTRTAMLEYIRSKLGVTKDEWHDVAINIDQTIRQISDMMEDDYRNQDRTASDADLAKLNEAVRDGLADTDLEGLDFESSDGKSMMDDIRELKRKFKL